MTAQEIKQLTEEFNSKRHNFSFPTISASEEGVKSILDLNPYIVGLTREEQINEIAYQIYLLAFE